MVAIATQNLSQRYGARWILARLTFRLPTGARLLLTGENGAGKTTLLRVLATALRPSRGNLEVLGTSVWPNGRHVRQRLALMTHQHYLYEALSAAENLALVKRLAGDRAKGSIDEVLETVGLADAGRAAVQTYSAGMKRRLALGRLLLLQPEIVLFDEPFAQLDPAGQKLVTRLIAEMAKTNTTLVIASHDVEKTKPLCTHHLHLTSQGVSPSMMALPPVQKAE